MILKNCLFFRNLKCDGILEICQTFIICLCSNTFTMTNLHCLKYIQKSDRGVSENNKFVIAV